MIQDMLGSLLTESLDIRGARFFNSAQQVALQSMCEEVKKHSIKLCRILHVSGSAPATKISVAIPMRQEREAQIKDLEELCEEKQQPDYISREQVTDLNRQVINVPSDCLCLLV